MQEELSVLLSLYEHMISRTIPYTDANSDNSLVENLYDDISLVYGMLGRYQSPNAAIALKASQNELLLETFFRAVQSTFRSKSTLRRIGWAACLAEAIEEGMMGFKMYLEKDKKDKIGEWWRRGLAEMDGERADDVVFVLLAACKLSLESLQV